MINKCLYAPVILIDSIYRKDETIMLKFFFKKYYFIEDMEIFCSYSDKEYFDEECIKIFPETLRK